MLQEMANRMFPEIYKEGLDTAQAASRIWRTWWEQVHGMYRPVLEFYERHLPETYSGITEKALRSPSRARKPMRELYKALLSVYERTQGMDAYGNPLLEPSEWPRLPTWFHGYDHPNYNLQKTDVQQYLENTFDVSVSERDQNSRTRLDPLSLPRRQEFKEFGPKEEFETGFPAYSPQ